MENVDRSTLVAALASVVDEDSSEPLGNEIWNIIGQESVAAAETLWRLPHAFCRCHLDDQIDVRMWWSKASMERDRLGRRRDTR